MRALFPVLILAASVIPGAAFADPSRNILVLDAVGDLRSAATVEIDGSFNALVITQTATSALLSPNVVRVTLSGDRNGGRRMGAVATVPLIADLPWGSLTQTGEANVMEIGVVGSDNLFAVTQSGSANTVLAAISGSQNQAAVAQVGSRNAAVLSQTGHGNMVSITQTSW